MIERSFFIFMFITFCHFLNAQCPSSNQNGIHIVQNGETLYRLAKVYKTSVNELANLNGITEATNIPICTPLKVPTVTFYTKGAEDKKIVTDPTPQPTTTTTTTTIQKPTSRTFAQRLSASGGTHITNQGETFEAIARYYGYTVERLLEMNSLDPGFQVKQGTVLVVSECYFKEGGVAYSTDTKIDYSGNSSRNYNQPKTRPIGYGQEVDSQQKNNAGNTAYNPITGTRAGNNQGANTNRNFTENKTTMTSPSTGGNAPQKVAANYMKSEELSMIDEINLVRSNPAGYIKYIEAYKGRIAKGEAFGTASVCDELIRELRALKPLSVLEPMQCIYDAAKKHGEDGRTRGSNDHVGSDGSWPWDRVLAACPDLTDGNENLVGGPASVRDAVIILLIDDGIPSRGHRRTMLKPEWKYVACYKIGMVGSMPNSWIQKYGH